MTDDDKDKPQIRELAYKLGFRKWEDGEEEPYWRIDNCSISFVSGFTGYHVHIKLPNDATIELDRVTAKDMEQALQWAMNIEITIAMI